MANPFFALYPTDFLADVGHLGNTELGIYWRLLLVYYRDGRPLPVDADKLRRFAMAFSPEEYRALDAVMLEFFVASPERDGTRVWRHKRADVELQRAVDAREKRSAGAKKTNGQRWGDRSAIAERLAERSLGDSQSVSPSESQSDGEPDTEKKEKYTHTPLARDAFLPKSWGEWAAAEYPGWAPDQVREVFAHFRDHFVASGVESLDWGASWRKWCRDPLTHKAHPGGAPKAAAAPTGAPAPAPSATVPSKAADATQAYLAGEAAAREAALSPSSKAAKDAALSKHLKPATAGGGS